MAIHLALSLTFAGSLALAGLLLRWADRVAGSRLLAAFLLGVAVWVAGNELPSVAGDAATRAALILLATAPLTAAVFVHFALVFCRVGASRAALSLLYLVGTTAALFTAAIPSGQFEPFAGVSRMAVPNAFGWGASLVWGLLAAAGQAILLRGFRRASGIERRRIAAVMASGAWGLACMVGYLMAALRLPAYPWPLLALPLYPVILVYGILRYRLLVANAWARRALAWTLLVALAGLVAGGAGALVPLLPVPGAAWLSGAVAAAAVLILGRPVRRLAQSIVYPGGTVSADDLRHWREALGSADTYRALAETATVILSRTLALPVAVDVTEKPADDPPPDPALTRLDCARQAAGWRCRLSGWDAAPPGPRHLAQSFADLLSEQAARVEGLEASRAQERERQHQARLAELGALAATVAHDVRNPLNIIGMAVATAPSELRAEVADQVRRISRLADDLLDYAKPWRINPVRLDLAERATAAARGRPGVVLGDGLRCPVPAWADPDRLDRTLANLLDNAAAAATHVEIDADRLDGAVRLHVCDDGPGIPAEIRDRLFEPFVSRRAGGSGLGLAIAARIMEAHGGAITLTEKPGWTTCFTLTLPEPRR